MMGGIGRTLFVPLLMPRRRVVPQKPPASIHSLGLPSRQQPSPVSPLFAALTDSLYHYDFAALISPAFSYRCALFGTLRNVNSFPYNHLRTLWQKHPGVGVSDIPISQASLEACGDLNRSFGGRAGFSLSVRGGCGTGSLQKFAGVLADVAPAKNSVARNQQFPAGAHHVPNRIQRDAAIPFDPEIQPAHFPFIPHLGNFLHPILTKL